MLACCLFRAEGQQKIVSISLLEAAQSVITKHPLIRYQEAQVTIDRGLKQQAAAAFDTVLNAGISQSRITSPLTIAEQEQNALIGAAGTDELTDLSQGSFGVSRLFRSGISIGETTTVTRSVDNLVNPQGVNEVSPSVQITLPLLRGRGRNAVAVQETAADNELRASVFDLTNEMTTLLANGVSDYWNVVADTKLVAIAKEAEERARTDLDNTQTLVSADRLPRENLNEVNANLAQSAAARIAAEQALIAAQYQLATDIGMDEQSAGGALLVPSDDFIPPNVKDYPALTAASLETYVHLAMQNRSDLIAAKLRIDEQKVLVIAARNRLLPQLNLTANGGYTGLQEGRRFKDIFTAAANNTDGPTVSGGISYSFAPRNDLARGAYTQAIATETQLEAQSAQLAHTIRSAVTSAAQAVRNAALETNQAQAAVEYYQQSLAGQREKYHLGTASVVDVLTVEDRLTSAMTTEVQAELAFALALTQFRSATGTMVPPGKTTVTLSTETLRTPPDQTAPSP